MRSVASARPSPRPVRRFAGRDALVASARWHNGGGRSFRNWRTMRLPCWRRSYVARVKTHGAPSEARQS